MANFSAKEILAEAWNITHHHRKQLFWYGFWPSFFSITVGMVLMYFQVQLFLESKIFHENPKNPMEIFGPILEFIFSPQVPTTTMVVSGILMFASSFFLPIFSQGAIISMIAQYKREGKMERGIGKGMVHFLPLFQFETFIKNPIKPFSLIVEFFFILRFLGMGALSILKYIFGTAIILGTIGLFFFTYAPQFIVIEGKDPSDAISKSMKKVVLFFGETLSLILFFFLIELRVIFNVLIILMLPFVMIAIGGVIAHDFIGFFAEGTVAIIILTLAAIFSGTLFILGNVAWTLAYLKIAEVEE